MNLSNNKNWKSDSNAGLERRSAGGRLRTYHVVRGLAHPCHGVHPGSNYPVRGAYSWFREVLPQEAHEAVTVEKEERLPRQSVPRCVTSKSANWSSGAIAVENLSLLGGCARRIGRRGGDGVARDSLWPDRTRQHLVSDQSAGRPQVRRHLSHELRTTPGLQCHGSRAGHFIHVAGSALVGLFYGCALPMFPRRPILLGGILAPLFWSGIFYAEMGIINPALQARIDWKWFIGVPVCVWPGGWLCRGEARTHFHHAIPALRRSRRY